MRTSLSVVMWLSVGTSTFVCADGPSTAVAEGEWLKLETVWNEAHVKGNVDALDKLWDAEVVFTVPQMPVMDKAAALAMWKSGRMSFQKYETSEVKSRMFGDATVVTGRLLRERKAQGRDMKDDWRFTKVYIRRGAQWQVVAWHASETGKE